MKIRDCSYVCDKLLPGVERPINANFDVDGVDGTFSICTYEFMRGGFGLKDGEYPGDYFITFHHYAENKNENVSLWVHISPSMNRYEIRDRFKGKSSDYRESIKQKALAVIISACVEV